MNSSASSEACDTPTSQQTAESKSLTRQNPKRISSILPVWRHLGIASAKPLSRNVNKHMETPQQGASAKHKGTSSRENVNKLNLTGVTSTADPHCSAESHSTLVSHASGTKVKKSTPESSISEEREECSPVIVVSKDYSEGQVCSPQNTVDNLDGCSAPYRFDKSTPAQAKRSKLKDEHERSSIKEETSYANGQLHHPQNNFSRENEMLGHVDFQNDCSFPTSFGKKKDPHITKLKHGAAEIKDSDASTKRKPNHYCNSPQHLPFDICKSECEVRTSTEVIFANDRQWGSELCESDTGDYSRVLRPGMVLLKGFLTLDDQVSVVRECRNLGQGPGGFYQPGYKYGAKLRLMMMCLGRDWDPQTRRYSNRRRFDNSRPPFIPYQFADIVNRAMADSQALTEQIYDHDNATDILPTMLPNICIVNFYSTTGRLGLHQDRDESPESLAKGLPVVSISVGDSAEFLYGDERDTSKAEKLVLESGDVLIFGGESRHIFHGVESIIPDSAPEQLLEETRLRPGRLNLTFRQF